MAVEIEKVWTALIPSPEECAAKAEKVRAAYPGLEDGKLAEKVVAQAQKFLAAAGAASGAVSNPLLMVPLALGEMTVVLRQEARLAGVVAALLEPAVLKDEDAFTADVLGILFPGAVSQALSQFAVRAGQMTSRTLIRKYISKDVLKAIIRLATKYLGLKLTQRALITKSIPIVGAAIGSTWNWFEVKRVGARAIRYYTDEELAGDEEPKTAPGAKAG